MKKAVFLSLLVFGLGFISCEEEPLEIDPVEEENQNNDPEPNHDLSNNFGNEITRTFLGHVIDENHDPVENANVQIGSSSTTTDANGVFIIPDASVHENFAYVKVSKNGYLDGSRAVVPTTGTNKVSIMLLQASVTGTTSSGETKTISLQNGASLKLQGEYEDENGKAYSGSVDVILHHLDPSDEDMQYQMPGMLYASNSENEERGLISYGMLAVELRGSNGEELNLAEGSTAEITAPLSPELLASAPSTMPLWYFDEEKGYWIEDGEAVLQGNTYVGTVSHFSFWNFDVQFPMVNLCIVLKDQNGNPISNAWVGLTHSNSNYGFPMATGTTNANGEVCGLVPANEALTLEIHYNCTNYVHSSTIGPYSIDSTENITIDTSNSQLIVETIQGNFNDCNGNAVTNGYVKFNYGNYASYHSVSNGAFSFNFAHCPGPVNFSIEGIDYGAQQSTGQINYSFTPPVTNLGVLSACTSTNELIYFSVDGGVMEGVFIDEINAVFDTANPMYDNNPTISIFGGAGSTGCFLMTGVLDATNYTGTYDYFYMTNPPVTDTGFFFPDCDPYIPYQNNNSTIVFNLTTLGNVGQYIDINFNGNYTDAQGVNHTLNGMLHVLRDN